MPEFSRYGFNCSEIIYEFEFYSKNESHNKFPRISQLNSIMKGLNDSKLNCSFVVFDIETWLRRWRLKTPFARREILGRYERIAEEFKQGVPNVRLGFYGLVPADLPRRDGVSYSVSKISKWQNENEARKKIVSKVDFFFPSFYTHTQSIEEWEAYAKLMINKARELDPEKKIIPYIWPKYHQAYRRKSGLKELYIPKEFWRAQLEFLYKNVDGIVIWDSGNKKKNWDEKAGWWKETLSFLVDKGFMNSE